MLNTDALLSAARAETGLSDLNDDSILTGLNILVDSLNAEANLSARGEKSFEARLVGFLTNRLRAEDYLTQHPYLLERPIERPMFVFGLPRTGTTLTINLLAADPSRRCYLRWEALESTPPPKPEELHAGPRYEKAQALIDMSVKYAPQISAMHHEDGDSPSECQFSMAQSFCAQLYDSLARIPSYHKWFMQADYAPAFRYHKRMLQLLQAEAPGRWTLKNPWHPLFLDDLTATYPDAQLVMNHRDPVDVVGSACSLVAGSMGMFTEQLDKAYVGEMLLDTFETMIQRALAYKQKHGADAIYDLQYDAQLRDPIGEMKKLYARFGESWTDAAETGMHAFLANNPKGKHGKHEYRLEDYGLTKGAVRERFSDYCRQFNIPTRD